MTPKISGKNQLFHVHYLSNGLTTGKIKKKCQIKKTEQKEGKIKYNPKVLEPLYLDFISKIMGSVIFEPK